MDPNKFLDASLSERAASGRRELTPQGTYDNCEVHKMEVMPPTELDEKNGNAARIKITFMHPASGRQIDRYVNIKKGKEANPHPRSTHFKLMAAAWPKIEERTGKTLRHLLGKRLTLSVTHEVDDTGVLVDEFRFIPVAPPVSPAAA